MISQGILLLMLSNSRSNLHCIISPMPIDFPAQELLESTNEEAG